MYSVLVVLLFVLVIECSALKCRTDGGPKESELKSVFMKCVRKMDRSSNSSMSYDQRGGEQGYRGTMSQGTMNQGTMSQGTVNQGTMSHGTMNHGTMSQEYDDRNIKSGRRRMDDNRDGSTMSYAMSDEATSEYPKYGYHSTTSSPRRYRRQVRTDNRRNSGHRSQYNPNAPEQPDMSDDQYRSESNMSDPNMTATEKIKGCVVHCFLQDMEMTGENGMPDRYMVTHVITKDVKNEDLKDFLQESIEECFQILYNENTQDKCEFSKNLMTCLSEKGRSNCDDWKEDGIGF